jgi:selenide,water dikinase
LAEVLEKLPQSKHPSLLVGFNKADDAGVFLINDRQALVQSVDFFPPIVDDPYYFGQIAAANALSDIYAMGGRPLTALNIVGFPTDKMPARILTEILRGANEKIEETGAVVVGGHSIKDQELKFGLAVTGLIDPDNIITNAKAKTGDRLFLTKPLGTGIITTGIKRNKVDKKLTDLVTAQMAALNRDAAELMVKFKADAATDITGFGLLGHAFEMAAASEVSILIRSQKVPLLERAKELADEGMIPGGANDNRLFLADKVQLNEGVDKSIEKVLFDPQTSGGLFIAMPSERADNFESEMQKRNILCRPVGEVIEKNNYPVIVE